MKNKFLSKVNLGIIFFLLTTLAINIVVLNSYRKQLILLEDYNNPGELLWNLDDLLDFSYEIPNISATSLPIKALISGYYEREGENEKAISLLKSSIKYNPYIKFNEYKLANIYNKLGKYDSAYFYFKNAYDGVPSNILHGSGLLNYLIERDSFDLAKKHFLNISSSYKHHIAWTRFLIYLQDKIQIEEKFENKNLFDSLINIAKNRFPEKNYFDEMDVISTFGLKDVIAANELNDSADNYFNDSNFQKANELYLKSIEIINDINIYENIMLTYLKLNKIDDAQNVYYNINLKLLEESFKDHKKGMIDYYMGVSFIEKNRDSSCFYFKKSKNKGNTKSKLFYDQICNK